jgi:hypothetical protein
VICGSSRPVFDSAWHCTQRKCARKSRFRGHGNRVYWAGMSSQPKTVAIGLVQNRCTGDRGENFAAAERGIRAAAARGARIVCLQELFLSLYFCQGELGVSVHFISFP